MRAKSFSEPNIPKHTYADRREENYTVNCDKCNGKLKQGEKAVIIRKGEIDIRDWNTHIYNGSFRITCVPCYRKMDEEPMDIDDFNEDLNNRKTN